MHRLRVFLRSLILPFALYGVAGVVTMFFVWHGLHGHRGLKTGEEYEQKLAELRLERDTLKLQRMQWEARIALVKGEKVDADIVDEEAHRTLGRAHKNELVILLPERAR